MPLVRMIVSARANATSDAKDAVVNTLYFNVSEGAGGSTDYQKLVDDLGAAWRLEQWGVGSYLDIRAYNMDDAEPRPVKARYLAQVPGTRPAGVPQVALCLSYFADRNLPRQRGRIYLGPWSTGSERPAANQIGGAIGFANTLANLGGANVDWSLYSPTTGTHTRINNAWVDNSWDIIRSRKLPGTSRSTWAGDG
jgi:hypothetical protein